jgi:NAD(P)-dependent dehydrogenase (short-subunit alcohol dehydrogenase family)
MRLQDRTAVITGGASGIGCAIARLFASEGASVLIADIDEEAGEKTAADIGARARFERMDATSERDVERVLELAVSTFGGLHIVVNNAGMVFGPWDKTIALNLSGVRHGCIHGAPRIAASGGGAIVNMSSMFGMLGAPGDPGYAASKHGVIGLTKTFALEYAAQGVRVNSLNPGWIATTFIDDLRALGEKEMLARTPLGRFGQPEEIAKAALFLASDDSSFMTGTTLVVDGGWTAQ